MFTFTAATPQLRITRQVPFDLTFTLTPPPGWTPEWPLRLLHCRTGEGRPRDTEVFELKASARRPRPALVVELSGFGGKQPQFREPLKAELPVNGSYHVAFDGGSVVVNGMEGETHLALQAGTQVELLFGFDKPNEGVLETPIGWQLSGIPEADSAKPPVTQPPVPPVPPAEPPTPQPPITPPPVVTQPPVVVPPTAPPTPTPGTSLEDEVVADLRLLARKYAGRVGLPADLVPIVTMLVSGEPLDLRKVLITLLISRL